jgi:hypothetical protein
MTNSLEWKPSRRTLRRFTALISIGVVVLGIELVWLVVARWR